MPRQFGPIIRNLPRAISLIWRSSSFPVGPISRKPAEIIMAPLTPFSTHSLIMAGIVAAGVAIMAKSISAGMDFKVG